MHDARRVEEVHALGRLVGHLVPQLRRNLRHQFVVQQLSVAWQQLECKQANVDNLFFDSVRRRTDLEE